jgi:hypothetical protein
MQQKNKFVPRRNFVAKKNSVSINSCSYSTIINTIASCTLDALES